MHCHLNCFRRLKGTLPHTLDRAVFAMPSCDKILVGTGSQIMSPLMCQTIARGSQSHCCPDLSSLSTGTATQQGLTAGLRRPARAALHCHNFRGAGYAFVAATVGVMLWMALRPCQSPHCRPARLPPLATALVLGIGIHPWFRRCPTWPLPSQLCAKCICNL